MIEDFQCTCGADGGDAADHSMACALWDDEDFAVGYAFWDKDHEELVYLDAAMSLHDSIEEVLATDKAEDADEWEPPDDDVAISYDDACRMKEETLLEEWTEGDVPKNYTQDGISRIWNPEVGNWETKALGCYCSEPDSGANLCLHCQVWRPGKEAGETGYKSYGKDFWRPLTTDEEELVCTCDPIMQWQCNKCHVKRGSLSVPFEYWMAGKGSATSFTANLKPLCRHPGRALIYPDGLTLYGSSHSGTVPEGYKPDFAIYLDKCWTAQTLAIQVPWQDMGVPGLDDEHIIALVDLIGRMIGKGQTVEVGCIGGHGRTGTLLAIVGLEHGIATPDEAVEFVRKNYCEQAIETKTQEWYIAKYFAVTRGLDIPEKPAVATYDASDVKSGQHKGKVGRKKCDTQGVWYCAYCAKDAWDQDEKCFHCEATFDNPGVRPLTEWNEAWVNSHYADVKKRIAKAILLEAEAGHGTTTLKVVTGGLAVVDDGLYVDPQGFKHSADCICSHCGDPVDTIVANLTLTSPHIQSRLPFQRGRTTDPTQQLLGKMRLTQPIGTLTTFSLKGRSYVPTSFECSTCGRRLYYKIRPQDPKTPFRMELVHADDLTKLARHKGKRK